MIDLRDVWEDRARRMGSTLGGVLSRDLFSKPLTRWQISTTCCSLRELKVFRCCFSTIVIAMLVADISALLQRLDCGVTECLIITSVYAEALSMRLLGRSASWMTVARETAPTFDVYYPSRKRVQHDKTYNRLSGWGYIPLSMSRTFSC